MTLVRFLTTAALVAIVGVSTASAAPHSKLDNSLRRSVARGCSGNTSVIIRTTPGGRATLSKSLTSHGRKVKGEFPALDAMAVEVNCDDLTALTKFNEVASMSDNARIYGHQISTAAEDQSASVDGMARGLGSVFKANALLSRVNEAVAAQGLQANTFATLGVRQSLFGTLFSYSAPSIGVAVIDSGIQPGIDFGSRITGFYDFTHGDIRVASPSDEYGHGTHIAGLVAGTYVGVAPSARLIGLKVLDGNGQGTTDNVIRAIEFAIANKSVLGIHVINLSLGHPIFESAATDPLVQAVEHASRSGIMVVVSAGNYGRNRTTGLPGYAGIASPGNAPSGISVGSLRTFETVSRADDRIATYSSRGPSWYDAFAKPDIAAPGDNLLSVAAVGSTLRRAQEQRGNIGNYMRLSGTSMAAGVVSGMVAVILQNNARLTPNAVKMVLQYSSVPVNNDDGTASDVLTQGAGALNGYGAVTLARAINPLLALGQKWLTTTVTPRSTIGGQVVTWSQRVIWGKEVVRGNGIIDEQRPLWALNIVWGNVFGDDDNIVWGNLDDDNIVWGNLDDDNIVWGNNVVWGNLLVLLNDDDNIVWGNAFQDDDNIVWGNLDDDNIVWGNSYEPEATSASNSGHGKKGGK